MIVAVRGLDDAERAPAVDRLEHRRIHDPHHVGVLRVSRDFHVVPAARLDQAILAEARPGLSRVVGAIEATPFRLDDRVHAVRVGRRDADTDLAHQRRQPCREARPAVAAIDGLPDAASVATAADLPRRALVIPEGRVQDARVGGIHREVAGAAERIHALEHQRPGRAAIARPVDATFGGALPAITLRRDVHHVWIGGMHAHGRDLARGAKTDVGPRAALIRAAIDAIAIRGRLPANRLLAHADVDHVRVGWRDGDRADRTTAEVAVGDVAPVDAGVVGAPEPTAGVAREVGQRLRRDAGRCGGPATAPRADVAPLQCAERRGVGGHRGRRDRRHAARLRDGR